MSTLRKTGPIVVLANIVKYLDRSQFEPIILTLSSEPDDSMLNYFKDTLNIRVDSLNLSRIKGLLIGKSKIKKYINENDIDIVHTHGIRADGFLKKMNITKVSTLHNYPYYDYSMKFGKLKAKIMIQNHMSTIKENRRDVIACSNTISEEFKQNRLVIPAIQNGVDTEVFKAIDDSKKIELKEALEISKDKKIFITVGSLIPRKDMQTVIDGFKLYNKNNDSLLLIAGDGFKREKLEAIADESIIFLGNIPNVVEYLQLSDCFVSASLAEGLPNTVLEAMACGLPIVLSDIPSHLELFENEEFKFFEIKDTQKLSELLESVSNDFLEEQELSLKMIREKFSAKTMSEKYQKVYMEKINE